MKKVSAIQGSFTAGDETATVFLTKLSEKGVNRRLCDNRKGFADVLGLKITVEYPAWIGLGPFLKKKKQF